MRLWVGVALLLLSCHALANSLQDEAAAWRATDMSDCPASPSILSRISWRVEKATCSPLIQRFVSNELCYSNREWLYSCLNALNTAGTLFTPGLHIATDGREIHLESRTSTPSGPTWREVFMARDREARDLRQLGGRHFDAAAANPALRFNFDAALLQMSLQLPAGLPVQMLWGYAINGHLRTYDAHAYIMPSTTVTDSQNNSSKSFVGIGLNLDFLPEGVLVHQVFAGTPAALAGLHEDDRVLAVAPTGQNFIETAGLAPNEIYDLFSGADYTSVGLRVVRDGKPLEFIFPRGPVDIHVLDSDMLDSETGYIVLRTFRTLDLSWEVRDKMNDLVQKGAKKFIFDVRGNPGGGTRIAAAIAGLFVGQRPVVGTEAIEIDIPSLRKIMPPPDGGPLGDIGWENGSSRILFPQPMVVLVDGMTASAAEIFADAIQYYRGNAWVVGDHTAGKGTTQSLASPLNTPSVRIARTVGRFYLADGRSNQLLGITPNFDVPLRFGADRSQRYYPNEHDFYPNGLSAENPVVEWQDPRAEQVAQIRRCIAKDDLDQAELKAVAANGSRADYQKAYALAVLKCF